METSPSSPEGQSQYQQPSMEPPPFSDGNLAGVDSGWQVVVNLQWSHRLSAMETIWSMSRRPSAITFNGATAFQRWKLLRPKGATVRMLPFNGATAFQRWKLSGWHGGRGYVVGPSMEPPPFSDGNKGESGHTNRGVSRPFNGATAFQRWKLDGADNQGHGVDVSRPFNGATAFQRWKRVTVMVASQVMIRLQWSHRLSAMETIETVNFTGAGVTAFNGATAFQRWKRLKLSTSPARVLQPSMEPPPFSDGNDALGAAGQARRGSPSMEPPPFSDGNTAAARP